MGSTFTGSLGPRELDPADQRPALRVLAVQLRRPPCGEQSALQNLFCSRLVRGLERSGQSEQRVGEDPQCLYTVRFAGRDLWGPDSDATVSVSFDAFEPYLEAA